jgi:hypothetical protein
MSAPGRTWHGSARPGIGPLRVSQQKLSDLREHVEALLAWAEATPTGDWHLEDDERAFMASISTLFEVPIPIGTFRSSETAARFLRVVALALKNG